MGEAGHLSDAPPPSRSAPRLSYEAVVRLLCDGRRGIHTGFVRDLARGGMFLRLVDPEAVGKRLGFELFLPGWRMPARGVGEVAWRRERYEGPGRPPGMAVRFVALEAMAIEMLSQVLGAEPMVDEVLEPRPLPVRERDAREDERSLEELIAESTVAAPPLDGPPTPLVDGDVIDPEGAVIFVPPPSLPMAQQPDVAGQSSNVVPLLPPQDAIAAVPSGPSRLRWGSAAAGIAAIAGLASLVVVGAARREVVVVSPERAAPAAIQPARGDVNAPPVDREVTGKPAAAAAAPSVAAEPPSTIAAAPAQQPAAAMAESVPALAPAVAAGAAAAPARALVSLRWEPLAGGGTRVVLALDGTLPPERLHVSRIGGDSPRLVVRLLGISGGAPRAPWEPATEEVRRIRAGRHDGDGGAEVHLVLDLVRPAVRLAKKEVIGSNVYLDLM